MIIQKRKEGIDSVEIAVELLAIALSDTITQSDLSLLELEAIEGHALGRVEHGTDFAKAVRAYLGNCLAQKDLNKTDKILYQYAITEVVGSLRGMDDTERSNNRLLSGLDEALFPPEDQSG